MRRILGVKQPGVQNMLRELRLHYDALANEADEVQLLAKVTGRSRELTAAWEKGSLEAWPGHVQNAKHNLAKLIEQAVGTIGTKLGKSLERLELSIDAHVYSFLHQPQAGGAGTLALAALGLNGTVALLGDAIQQADLVSEKRHPRRTTA